MSEEFYRRNEIDTQLKRWAKRLAKDKLVRSTERKPRRKLNYVVLLFRLGNPVRPRTYKLSYLLKKQLLRVIFKIAQLELAERQATRHEDIPRRRSRYFKTANRYIKFGSRKLMKGLKLLREGRNPRKQLGTHVICDSLARVAISEMKIQR